MTQRIEKTVFISFALLSLSLGWCSNSQTISTSSILANTATVAVVTAQPTSSAIPTETPIPTIEIDGVQVADPHFSNPDYFSKGDEQKHTIISNFASAMQVNDMQDSIVNSLTYTTKNDASGNKLLFMVTSNLTSPTGLEINGIPLLIARQENGKWKWSEIWMRDLADAIPLTIEAPGQVNVERVANQVVLNGELDLSIVFNQFSTSDWLRVIDNWDDIKKELDQGNIPKNFYYNWNNANMMIARAKKNNMTVRAQHLLAGGDVPSSIYNGGFSSNDIKKIAEFVVKVRVLKYNGKTEPMRVVDQWDVADEWAASITFPHDTWTFWIDNLGGFPSAISEPCKWIREANPDAQIAVVEDGILHLPPEDTAWRKNFNLLLDYIIKNNVPVTFIGIENNFWVNDPPTEEEMRTNLKRIMELGFQVTSETSVVSSNEPLVWIYQNSKVHSANPEVTQALIYSQNLKAYLDLNATQYGFAGINDDEEFYGSNSGANSTMFHHGHTPKLAYYLMLKLLYDRLH